MEGAEIGMDDTGDVVVVVDDDDEEIEGRGNC